MTKVFNRQHNVYYEGAPIFFTTILCNGMPLGYKRRLIVDFINISCKSISEIFMVVIGSEKPDGDNYKLPMILRKGFDIVKGNERGRCFYELDVEKLDHIDCIWCSSVVFEDNSIWECPTDGNWNIIPKQKLLFTHLGEELYRQYKRDVSNSVWTWYVPDEYAGVRRCACGGINSRYASHCCKCSTKLDYVFLSLDIELLKKNYEVYKKAYDIAKRKEYETIKTRCECFQLILDDMDTDPLEREKELRFLVLKRDDLLEKEGYTLFPDRNYCFIRKKDETDIDLLKRGCIPPNEQYSFWRHPKTKDTELLTEGYRPPDESHDRWYWPEERVR